MNGKPVSMTAAVREVLMSNIDLTADQVIQQVLRRGIKASPDAIRKSVHNQRNPLKKELAAKKAPTAARSGAVTVPAAATPAPVELSSVLGNVALVNKVVGAVGGPEQARQVAEAVRSCGSVDAFLQHLDIVAGIRGATAG